MNTNEENDRPFYAIDDPEHPAPRDGTEVEIKKEGYPSPQTPLICWFDLNPDPTWPWRFDDGTKTPDAMALDWPTHWRPVAPTPAPAPATSETPRTDEQWERHDHETIDEASARCRHFARTLERELTAATRRAEEAERERDEWKAQAEHQSAIAKQGLVVVGEAANELAALRETLRQVQAERDEANALLKNVSNVDTGAEPERVVHRVKLEQREIEPFLSKYES